MKKYLVALALLLLLPSLALAAQNTLTWTDTTNNETLWVVERKAEACAGTAAFAEILPDPPSTTMTATGGTVNYVDTTVQEGVTYCYRVAARNPAGTGAYSNTAGRAVPFTVPTAAPTGLTVQ